MLHEHKCSVSQTHRGKLNALQKNFLAYDLKNTIVFRSVSMISLLLRTYVDTMTMPTYDEREVRGLRAQGGYRC
jgi:hypothetical protein